MGSEDIKSAITGWSNTDELQLVEDLTDSGSDFALGLRAAAGSGTVPVEVLLETGADRLTVRSTSSAAVATDAVAQVIDARPALVSAQPASGGEGTVVTGHVFLDGFSKQTFFVVVREVAKTAGLLNARAGATAGDGVAVNAVASTPVAAASTPSPLPQWSPQAAQASPGPYSDAQPVTPAASQPLPAPTFGGAAQPQPGYGVLGGQPVQPQPAAQPQAQPSMGFAPTHTVPPQGMQAWAAPDPNGAVVATLGGGLPIQVSEVRGAWARVLCSNGWTGWVDGRIIGVAR